MAMAVATDTEDPRGGMGARDVGRDGEKKNILVWKRADAAFAGRCGAVSTRQRDFAFFS